MRKLMLQYSEIPDIDTIGPADQEFFLNEYFNKKPVLVKGYLKNSKAATFWDEKYFIDIAGETKVKVTQGYGNDYHDSILSLSDYLKWLIKDEKIDSDQNNPVDREVFYLNHVLHENINKNLINDLDFVPKTFVGDWYLKDWKRMIPIYYGNKNTVTPLHYDALGAHNSFFQIKGRKLFVLIPLEQAKYCYISKQNTISLVDFANPDYDKFPLLKKISPCKAILEGGDLLYIPPYMLHYVKGLELNISTNIEWHTLQSVTNTFSSGFTKRPRHHFWNALFFLGLFCKIPCKLIAPIYRLRFN